MKSALQIIIVIAVAILLAIGSFYYLAGWYNVIPWAIVSLIIGYNCKTTRSSLLAGAIFGYFLFLTYIFMGYTGNIDSASMLRFILFDVAFSLIGAAIGAGGAFGGFWARKGSRR